MLKKLFLEPSIDTPEVILDKESNILQLSGRSIAEDSEKFFQPIIEWLENYFQDPNPETVFLFKLDYYNTASAKKIMRIFMVFKEAAENGHKVVIKWFYDEEDEGLREEGEEFSRIIGIPFEYVEN